MHNNLGLNTLEIRKKQHTYAHVYKGLNDLSTPTINSMFNIEIQEARRRTWATSNQESPYPDLQLNISRKGLRYRGVKVWNPIETDIEMSPSYDIFKSRIHNSNTFTQ